MVNVLHAFNRYLPQSQNWAHGLISQLQSCNIHVYAKHYEKSNFYTDDWNYLDTGLSPTLNFYLNFKSTRSFFVRGFFRTILPSLKKKETALINQYIRDKSIQIVHSHFGNFACVMQNIIKDSNVHHVISFYGFDYGRLLYTNPEYKAKYKRLFESASAFICEGSKGVEQLVKLGCPEHKIHIVRLGIPKASIGFLKRVKKKNNLRLVQIAALTEKKGHYYTIRAFTQALKTCPEASLTIVGQPKSKEEEYIVEDIHAVIKKESLQNKIQLINRIDFHSLKNFLGQFDVFIHPSCYAQNQDSEGGAPVVLLNAQATGMPVISTNHCDIPDEVQHMKTGYLTDEKDIMELSKAIDFFYRMNQDEYNEFGTNAIQHMHQNYTLEISGEQLDDIYRSLLK